MSSRREQFREYMARLSPAAHPRHAIREELYVERPDAAADHLVRRLELEPSSSHLLVGGVGSGKTTQLLVAQKKLAAVPDILSLFLDVSEKHDLTQLRPGVLIVIAGLALSELVDVDSSSEEIKRIRERFQKKAHGYVDWVDTRDEYSPPEDDDAVFMRPVTIKGILIPPEPELRRDIRQHVRNLATLRNAPQIKASQIVVLFDSLDRVTDLQVFGDVVDQDVKAIKSVGIGVVLVGPLQTLFGTRRTMTDRFDYLYHQPAIDVEQDSSGIRFLADIIRKRVSSDILMGDALTRLVQLSGGVLRDLISLARAAGEEAYITGANRVAVTHVEAAADAFGRALMLGLGRDEIEVLQRLRVKGVFVSTSDKDVALLVTRRVLEYGTGRQRYVVHPTIGPLLTVRGESP